MSETIKWKYPIRGISEMMVNDLQFDLVTNCKQPIIQDIKIYPPGIPSDISHEELRIEFGNIPKSFK